MTIHIRIVQKTPCTFIPMLTATLVSPGAQFRTASAIQVQGPMHWCTLDIVTFSLPKSASMTFAAASITRSWTRLILDRQSGDSSPCRGKQVLLGRTTSREAQGSTQHVYGRHSSRKKSTCLYSCRTKSAVSPREMVL
jgi:hypothetical protein